MEDKERHPWLYSFGRRRGRKLGTQKSTLLETLLPKIHINLEGGENSPAALAASGKPIWLEIGFGGGEHLAAQAANYPDVLFIGCEPYIDGVASLLVEIEERGLNNVRIFSDDARFVLSALPDGCIDKVFILFPDPWPKIRHQKRRIVSQETLNMLARIMKPGAELQLATDHVDYSVWMLEQVQAHPDYSWIARQKADWLTPPEGWFPTRYQEKTEAEGRKPIYYRALRG